MPLTQQEINERVLSADQPTGRYGARAVSGGVYAVGAQFVRMGLQIVSVAVLARLLIPEQFGLVAMGGTVTALIGALTEFYISAAAIQRERLDQSTASGLLLLTMVASVVTFLIASLAAPGAAWVFHDPRVAMIVIGLGAASPIQALGALHQALMQRNMRWFDLQLSTIGGLAIGVGVSIIAAWAFHAGYWALLIQTWVGAGATAALSWLLCPWRPSWPTDWTGTKESVKFGLHLTGAGILVYFQRQLDNILIGWRWGSTELGFYSRAFNLLATPLNFLSGPLATAMVPAMSRMQSDPEKWRAAYLEALAAISIIGAAMAALLYGGANTIIDVVLGPGWGETKLIFSNMVIAMLAATPMRTTGWIYISTGRTDRMLRWAMIGTPMYVAAFFIGLPYGAAALALCYSISQLIAFFPCMWMATRETNIKVRDIIAVVAVPTLAAMFVGISLQAITAQLDTVRDIAAIMVAGALYVLIVAVAVWYLPVYRRLRERALNMMNSALVRLAPRLKN